MRNCSSRWWYERRDDYLENRAGKISSSFVCACSAWRLSWVQLEVAIACGTSEADHAWRTAPFRAIALTLNERSGSNTQERQCDASTMPGFIAAKL